MEYHQFYLLLEKNGPVIIRPIVTRYVFRVYKLLPDPPAAIDDLVQDAITKAYATIQFKRVQEESLKIAIVRQAMDVSFAFIKRVIAMHKLKNDYRELVRQPVSWNGGSQLEIKDLLAFMRRHLDPQTYQIVYMRIIEGYKYAELAYIFKMNEVAVRQVVCRAVKKLRDIFNREMEH